MDSDLNYDLNYDSDLNHVHILTTFCIFSIGSCSVFFCLFVIQLFGCYTSIKLCYEHE